MRKALYNKYLEKRVKKKKTVTIENYIELAELWWWKPDHSPNSLRGKLEKVFLNSDSLQTHGLTKNLTFIKAEVHYNFGIPLYVSIIVLDFYSKADGVCV